MYDLFRAACSEKREGGALRRWASTWNLYCGQEENTCRPVECQNDKVKDSDARECVISCRIPYGWEITHSRELSFFLKVSVSLLLLSFIPVACGEMLSVSPGVSCTDMFFPSNCRFVHVR